MKLTKELWKAGQAERKAELKELAQEIKALKPIVKDNQREHSYSRTELGITGYMSDMPDTAITEIDRDKYLECLRKLWHNQNGLRDAQIEYRRKHIIYSLYNGKTLEQIEPNRNEDKWDNDIGDHDLEIRKASNYQVMWAVERNKRLSEMAIAV